MKLILSGGGSGEKSKELDDLFASLLDKSKPLLYIPIAIDITKHPYSGCLEWLKSTFDGLGVKKYIMWVEKDLEKAKSTSPDEFSGIYIGGGNTFYLMKKLRESGFWDFLQEAIVSNIPVYGGSAGAAILSKSLNTVKYYDRNWVDLRDFSAGNYVKNYDLILHYDGSQREKVLKILKETQTSAVALTERNGLFIDGDKITLMGQESGYIFRKQEVEELRVGEEIN